MLQGYPYSVLWYAFFFVALQVYRSSLQTMDHIIIKTVNPKCRLYWCLIEFIDWRLQSVVLVFSTPLVTSAPLTFSLVDPPPFPFEVREYVRGGNGIRLCGEHLQE